MNRTKIEWSWWRRWGVAGGLASALVVAGCSANDSGDPVVQDSETTDATAGSSSGGAASPTEASTGEASTGAEPSAAGQLVDQHLRSIEAGDWETALADLDEGFQLTGLAPFPIPKAQSMLVHQLRKTAFPDFAFNEVVLADDGEAVELEIRITGTHLGVFDYTAIGITEVVQPTCKTVDLPPEYFTFTVNGGKIVAAVGLIPEGAGPAAVLEQIGPPPYVSECP